MRIKIFIKYFVILALTFVACEKETELDIPEPSTKLVVNSVLVVNEPLKIYVAISNYVMDTNATYITNAQVIITNKNKEASDTLPYTQNGFYQASSKLCEPNTTYTVEVTTKNFGKATATTYVPSEIKFTDYSLKTKAGISKDGFKNKLLTIAFSDNIEISNYYRLMLEWHSLDSIGFEGFLHNNAWYSYSPIIIAEGSDEESVFSDALFNGKQAIIPMNFNTWNYEDHHDSKYIVKCYLITVCENYYKYHKSLILQEESENNIWQANSPPQIYSNVNNAFGIFLSINICDSIIIEF